MTAGTDGGNPTGRSMPSAIDAATAVRDGSLAALELVEDCLARIAAGDDRLNAFVHVDADGARRAAEAIDARV
ncbi:MAG TPA: amidase family protein, partial [Microthrixaceae bacterium]|nr:amidase family protein [Microthrixaceae bacterium]